MTRLGFNLPEQVFEASIQAEDELAGAAVEGRQVADEAGRHRPPAGRSRPLKRSHEDAEEVGAEPGEPSGARWMGVPLF